MKLIAAIGDLSRLEPPFFATVDAAAVLGVSPPHASKILERLAAVGLVRRLVKGKWCLTTVTEPLLAAGFLTTTSPSYVSLQTALHYHGLIDQVPTVIYAMTLARTRRIVTNLSTFSFHHIEPPLFFGFDTLGPHGLKMATPEKALLDLFYLTPVRSRLFASLPEVELPQAFNTAQFYAMIRKIPDHKRRAVVLRRFDELNRGVSESLIEDEDY